MRPQFLQKNLKNLSFKNISADRVNAYYKREIVKRKPFYRFTAEIVKCDNLTFGDTQRRQSARAANGDGGSESISADGFGGICPIRNMPNMTENHYSTASRPPQAMTHP